MYIDDFKVEQPFKHFKFSIKQKLLGSVVITIFTNISGKSSSPDL